MKRYALALLLILLVSSARSFSSEGDLLAPQRFMLNDGMPVILQEVHSMPLASVNLFVKAGGMYENARDNGLSHFSEHMFFRGTPTRTGTQIKQTLEGLGGQTNAETSKDYTHYFVNVPSAHLKETIDVLADCLMHSTFSPEAINLERNAVLDEYRIGLETPGQIMQTELYSKAFSVHPYRLPVIGTEANIDRFTQQDFINFHKEFYVPERTALVIVGDFDTRALLPYLNTLFADYKSTGVPVPPTPQEPPLGQTRDLTINRDFHDAYLLLGYRAPTVRAHQDIYKTDVLCFLLGQGRGCLLSKDLVDQKQLARAASVDFLTERDPSLLEVSIDTTQDKLKEARQEVFAVLDNVRHGRFSDDDLTRARNLLVSSYIMGNETNAGKADTLGFYEMIDHMDFATG
ncbi:MAG: M16 family metallopeptidase, partial [Candidatus Xenobia bacterium]